jgi:PPOX class probable F420-dependent enzyme
VTTVRGCVPRARPSCGHERHAARILRLLEREPIVWLSTVRPEGAPHLVPIWFWWDGEAMLVFSKPGAQKVRNLRSNPTVMLALGDAEDDFDVGLIEGRAELLDRPTREVLPEAHLAKYASQLAAIGVTAAEYAATYSQVIRIVPEECLPWHGRTMPQSARLAGAPAVSIDEPRRTVAAATGEFVSRRAPRAPRAPRSTGRLRQGWSRLAGPVHSAPIARPPVAATI